MIIWIIGLSGSGKSTLSNQIEKQLKHTSRPKVVFMDGDIIREAFNHDLGYTVDDRLLNAKRLSVFCKFLDDQNIDVVCSVLSFKEETRIWNRQNIQNYYEVFIDAPLRQCEKRDVKGLYNAYSNGDVTGLVGKDIQFEVPQQPDLVINNNGSLKDLLKYAKILSELII